MALVRPYILSIAGFDPSAGAGVLADIKTFEQNKAYGLGVISGNTFQNAITFKAADWIPSGKIIEQFNLLYERHPFKVVKIGLVESLMALDELITALLLLNSNMQIIWDPIMKASAGFEFHNKPDDELLKRICQRLFLITPNIPELAILGGTQQEDNNITVLSTHCHVFLKGGHSISHPGRDRLFTKAGKCFSFRPKKENYSPKHGSGCVLSSAIAAALARGFNLHRSCLLGKQYTANRLKSNKTLLAYHKL